MTSEKDILPASKAIKLSHSPTPASARLFNKHQANANTSSEYSPTVNIQVVAATILYLAFSHLDHWPVQLVKAYAEDCFGPRSWVDNESCKLLVDNLRLLHKPTMEKKQDEGDADVDDHEMEDASCLEDAEKVSNAYGKLQEFIVEQEDAGNDHASPSQQRRGSLSSVGSTGAGPITQSASMSSLVRSNSRDEADSGASNGSGKKKKKISKKLLKHKKPRKPKSGKQSARGELNPKDARYGRLERKTRGRK